MIVWATTFSLLTLFLPKLITFFTPAKDASNHLPELTGGGKKTNIVDDSIEENDDLMSLNEMVYSAFNESKVKLNSISFKGKMNGAFMEVHEVKKTNSLKFTLLMRL